MLKIRRARAKDVDVLFDIRTSVTQNRLSRPQLAALGITEDTVSDALESATCGWLADIDGAPAAFAMVDHRDGSVFALFVSPHYEGRGAGKLLLREAEDELFKAHDKIWLETDARESVRANGFYRANGWVSVGVDDKRSMRYEKNRPLRNEDGV